MHRKNFLQALTVGAASLGAAPAIAQRKAITPSPPGDVKITAIKAFALPQATFVKVETDAGISGWGEADHDNPKMTKKLIEERLASYWINQDPWQTEHLWHRMFFKEEDFGSTGFLPGAMSGIDNALWDLKGKLVNLPVYKLLGGANPGAIQLYGSFGRTPDTPGLPLYTPAEMAAIAANFVQQGYKAVKARMQIRTLNVDPNPDLTFDIVKAVRKAIGDEIELFVDFNNGYTPAKAISMAKRLIEHCNIAMVEEPVTYHNYHDLAEVVAALDIPVAAGEHEYNRWQMREMITTGKVDIVNTDVIKAGGISENRKIAALAHAFDRPVMVHNTRPTLMSAASLHFLASIENPARFQEFAGFRPAMKFDGLFDNILELKDGFIKVPQTAGIGLVANEKAIEKAAQW